MRILHTSDWHLGKSLKSKPRLAEQLQMLDCLKAVCEEQSVDIVLVCGDVFDTVVPKAEAEELFYTKMAELSRLCCVVCLAGNHDDGERLAAPQSVAILSGIYLVGGMDNTHLTSADGRVTGGDGWLKIKAGGEILNLALLPYPFFSGLISQTESGTNDERVSELINRSCACFGGGVNVFASHLFVSGSEVAEERELGTAPVLSKTILPQCDYVALGHIHKPQSLSRSRHIFYSGSPLSYSFDDTTDKFFFLFDSREKTVNKIPVSAGKKLVTVTANNVEEAEAALNANPDGYVKLIYCGAPLALSEIKRIRAYPAFTDIRFEQSAKEVKRTLKADASPLELFKSFYFSQRSEQPDNELTELFLSIFGGEE